MTGTLTVPTIGQPNSTEDVDIRDALNTINGLLTGANALDGGQLGATTVVAAALASNAVTTAKILDANVTTAKIGALAVTTALLADLNVTTGKIADDAVTNAKVDSTTVAEPIGLNEPTTARRGKSVVATEQSTTSTSFVTLTTPDQVASIVLPTDGLIFVAYRALWKLTGASNPANVQLFLGSNEVLSPFHDAAPQSVAASLANGSTLYGPLQTSPVGTGNAGGFTAAGSSGGSDSTYVTTGQYLGQKEGSAGHSGALGSPVVIEAAAGTYTISVRFKVNVTSGGTLFLKERKLWVWTMGF